MLKPNACPRCKGDVLGRRDKKWCSERCRSESRDQHDYNAARYAATKDERRVAHRAWSAANRDHVRAKRREWVDANREAVRAYQLTYQRAWYPANRDRQSEYQSRRRSRKAAGGSYSIGPADYAGLMARHSGLCAYCRATPATEWDHVVPLSRGGRHSLGNLAPTCLACNRSKGAKLLIEWRFDLQSLTVL